MLEGSNPTITGELPSRAEPGEIGRQADHYRSVNTADPGDRVQQAKVIKHHRIFTGTVGYPFVDLLDLAFDPGHFFLDKRHQFVHVRELARVKERVKESAERLFCPDQVVADQQVAF